MGDEGYGLMDESLGAPEAQDIDHLAPKEQVEYYLKALMVGPEQASTSGSRESDLIIRDRTGREVGTARVDLDGTADGSAESFVSLLDKNGNPYELFYYF